MFKWCYNCALVVFALAAFPRWFWRKGGKNIRARLGCALPHVALKEHVIWIHAVSLGETRAVLSLFALLKTHYPTSSILISSTTETGHEEARRSMPEADAHFFLPLDFSWTMRRLVSHFHPQVLILVESDLWYNLITAVKSHGGKVLLVNGKISERSTRRFQTFPFLTRRIFSQLDHLFVQSERFQERFASLHINPAHISITGNLKLDTPLPTSNDLHIPVSPTDLLIVVGSTHDPEEELILSALAPILEAIPQAKVLLVPRHPERFNAVSHLLTSRGYSPERIILVREMGVLNQCYHIARVAIVGGSFTDRIGGHNIFEPILCGVPVLFGPHMHHQLDMVERVLQAGAGKQVSLKDLPEALHQLLTSAEDLKQYSHACAQLSLEVRGSAERTFSAMKPFLS